jgi:hypothetical protein
MKMTKPISRRTLLRGATGAGIALPMLEIMTPRKASAQAAPKRFVGFFYPCGTDPRKWNPAAGALTATSVSECLQDLKGFATEGIWPAEVSSLADVTVLTGIDHSGVCVDIHMPSMSLSAHKGTANSYTPPQPTLDQYLADSLQGTAPYRNLALSATPSTDIGQGNISFRTGGQVASVVRNPRDLFNTLFGSGMTGTGTMADRLRRRQTSVLDGVLADANRLNTRLGAGDKQRLGQYLQSISEVEKQIGGGAMPMTCTAPAQPATGGNWHSKSKLFIDLAVLAMACDLTRVVTLQYSDSWGVSYTDYPNLGTGMEALKTWSDHFISHKLDDTDRATDLDGLPRADAQRIADARVVLTSRFKVRRFAYLINQLKRTSNGMGGTLLDDSLVLYVSENGDGDSHGRKNMPILLAGHAGSFQTGRVVAATDKSTGALHASIIRRFGLDVTSYGSPAGTPIADL